MYQNLYYVIHIHDYSNDFIVFIQLFNFNLDIDYIWYWACHNFNNIFVGRWRRYIKYLKVTSQVCYNLNRTIGVSGVCHLWRSFYLVWFFVKMQLLLRDVGSYH